ncbi:MAG: hypothetical protein ACREFV_12480, partial [Acetobacteraceae bacterium]
MKGLLGPARRRVAYPAEGATVGTLLRIATTDHHPDPCDRFRRYFPCTCTRIFSTTSGFASVVTSPIS